MFQDIQTWLQDKQIDTDLELAVERSAQWPRKKQVNYVVNRNQLGHVNTPQDILEVLDGLEDLVRMQIETLGKLIPLHISTAYSTIESLTRDMKISTHQADFDALNKLNERIVSGYKAYKHSHLSLRFEEVEHISVEEFINKQNEASNWNDAQESFEAFPSLESYALHMNPETSGMVIFDKPQLKKVVDKIKQIRTGTYFEQIEDAARQTHGAINHGSRLIEALQAKVKESAKSDFESSVVHALIGAVAENPLSRATHAARTEELLNQTYVHLFSACHQAFDMVESTNKWLKGTNVN
jgi:hypothetical protein